MKSPNLKRLSIIGLSLLIISMALLMYNDYASSHFKYWLAFIIIVISLIIINYDVFTMNRKSKNSDNQIE